MKKQLLFFGVILLVSLAACKEEIAPRTPLYQSYFPIEVGSEWIYEVDSFVYDDFSNSIDTFQFRIKEIVDTTYIDNEGRTTFISYVYKEIAPDVWEAYKTHTSNIFRNKIEKVEDNQRYLKLIFPVINGEIWLGNAQNQVSPNLPWEYQYQQTHEAKTINGQFFDSTLVVLQHADSNAIDQTFSTEYYANHVGLVYKEFLMLETQNNNTKGLHYIQKISN